MTKRAVLAAVVATAACTTPPADITPVLDSEFSVSIERNDVDQRFDITLISLAHRPLCVQGGNWPDARGDVEGAADWIAVESDGRRFPIHDETYGDRCAFSSPPECRLRLMNAGDRLAAFISYDQFPAEAFNGRESINLVYPLRPHACSRGELQ